MHSLSTVPVKPKQWYSEHVEDYGKKWNVIQWKTQRSTLRNCSLTCPFFHWVKTYSTFPRLKVALWGFREGTVSGHRTPVSSKEIPSIENRRESFWANLLWCLYLSHRVKWFFGLSSLKSLLLWNVRKGIWKRSLEYPDKEITSESNQKEAFCETALCHVNSTHTVKFLFSLSSIITLCLFKLWMDILERFEAYGEKGNVFR